MMYNQMNDRYREQDVMGASPLRLILLTYDAAIKACELRNFDRATRAISVLRDALDFDQGEVSVQLFSIYQWCLDCVRSEDYQTALISLRSLREAWSELEKQQTAIPLEVEAPNLEAVSYLQQA